jgi:hypothetical protein
MDAAYDPGAWRDFGVALVSASAALLGLVFVVVSLHLRAVVDDTVIRRRAEIMLGRIELQSQRLEYADLARMLEHLHDYLRAAFQKLP